MNPYVAHSLGHQQLQALMEQPINGVTGSFILYASGKYPARVSTFTLQQILRPDGGGFSEQMMGSAIVTKSVLSDNINFHTGHRLTAIQPGGQERYCQIQSVSDEVTEFHLVLWAKSEGG